MDVRRVLLLGLGVGIYGDLGDGILFSVVTAHVLRELSAWLGSSRMKFNLSQCIVAATKSLNQKGILEFTSCPVRYHVHLDGMGAFTVH